MGEAILNLALEFTFHKLFDGVGQRIARFAGATEELEKLYTTSRSIRAVLRDAESRQVSSEGVRVWLSDLKRVADEIEDWMAEWEISVSSSVDTQDNNNDEDDSGIKKKVRALLLSPYNFAYRAVSRYKVARQMQEIRKRLNEIDREKNSYGFSIQGGDQTGAAVIMNRPPATSLMDETETIVGREDDKEKVISRLVSGSSDEDGQVHVVAIVGMGGLGKTTLARQIYHDDRVQQHFKGALYWVFVSEVFDVIAVTKDLLRQVKKDDPSPLSDFDSLQNELMKELKGKHFLLVLDDVWNDDTDKWETLRLPLKSGGRGSKILVTTRSRKAANTTNATYIHELTGLSEKDSWTLFSSKAFAKRTVDSALERIGREIVKNCSGLPLAIKVVGIMMHSKITEDDWKNILNSKLWSFRGLAEKVLPALLESYFNLPAHLKQCFIYCSLIPKKWGVLKDALVRLWMVQGFIQPEGNRDMKIIGEEYFNDLVALSMLQQVEKDGTTRCVMHDLLRDVAEYLAGDEIYTITSETVKPNQCSANVRHGFFYWDDPSDKPNIRIVLGNARNLRTLILMGVDGNDSVISGLFSRSRFLRTLDFQHCHMLPKTVGKLKHLKYLALRYFGMEELPNAIGKLKQLRYLNLSMSRIIRLGDVIVKLKYLTYLVLAESRIVSLQDDIGKLKNLTYVDLSGTNIVSLPESVGLLCNLHTLKLRFCRKLKELPRSLGEIITLRHLEIKYTTGLERLPKGLGGITCLETLNKFIVGVEGEGRIDELQGMNSLQGSLKIQHLERVSNREEAEKAELCNKSKLHRLVLEMSGNDEEVTTLESNGEIERMNSVLEGCQPHPNITELVINYPNGSKLPSWLEDGSSLPNLTCLKVSGLILCKHLPGFVKFTKLERLVLEDMPELEKCEATPEAASADVIMPSLRRLSVRRCPQLKALPPHLSNSHLIKLKLESCHKIDGTGSLHFPSLETFTLNASNEFFSTNLPDLRSLKEFLIQDITNKTLPDGGWERMVALRKLQIQNCKELMSLPDGLTQLSSLEDLEILNCIRLVSLPEKLGQLQKLISLSVVGLEELNGLPDSLGELDSLKELIIDGMKKFQVLPEWLGHFKELNLLRISGLTALTCLPNSLGQLQSLEQFVIIDLERLESLPDWLGELKKLESLAIEGMKSLTNLPDSLGQLKSLKFLSIDECKKLNSLPPQLVQLHLKSLKIGHLEALNCVPDMLGQFKSLETLTLKGWKELESLSHWLGQLKALRELDIIDCTALTSLPRGLQDLPLYRLNISGCPLLSKRSRLEDIRLGLSFHISQQFSLMGRRSNGNRSFTIKSGVPSEDDSAIGSTCNRR